jgi:hypothetical protein
MSGRYPADVTDRHSHFWPTTCPECGEAAAEGEECHNCGEYVPDAQDRADDAADAAYDAMREAA